jgi:hypothetical protein
MKNQVKSTILLMLLFIMALFTSCLKKDLPGYPSFEGASIDKVYLEYRYNGGETFNGNPVVAFKAMSVTQTIVAERSTINLVVAVPPASGSFTNEERDRVSLSNLIMYFDISTAASAVPVEGAPKLGDLVDLTIPRKYEVTAANGNKKTWTISVTSFNK